MTSRIHRERLLLILLGALGLPQMACGEKFTHEMCRALPADGQCMSRRDLWKELRWNKKGCGTRLVSIDSEAVIKYPDDWRGQFAPSFTPTQGSTLVTSGTGTHEGDTATSTSSTATTPGSTGSVTGSTGSTSTWPDHLEPPPKLACCYEATSRHNKFDGCVEGRPLFLEPCGAPLLAELLPGRGWTDQSQEQALPELETLSQAQRESMHQEWKRIAIQEHASIAAFAQLSLELLRYGAPSRLVEDCHACMQDEIRHAKLAIRWASHLGGQELAPGPMKALAQRPLSENLTQLALSNLEEGCCNETLATLLMLDRADHCGHPGMQAWITAIAQDEQRHAQFAWRLTRWFLEKEPGLWRVLDARMMELLTPEERDKDSVSAQQEILAQGKSELLAPLWQAMRVLDAPRHQAG